MRHRESDSGPGRRRRHTLSRFLRGLQAVYITVVVFPYDLKKIGDVRQLAGKVVEISGEVKEYDDRAEIVLEKPNQLGTGIPRLPPLPNNFDVEKRGHYSAGSPHVKRSRHSRTKKGRPT